MHEAVVAWLKINVRHQHVTLTLQLSSQTKSVRSHGSLAFTR